MMQAARSQFRVLGSAIIIALLSLLISAVGIAELQNAIINGRYCGIKPGDRQSKVLHTFSQHTKNAELPAYILATPTPSVAAEREPVIMERNDLDLPEIEMTVPAKPGQHPDTTRFFLCFYVRTFDIPEEVQEKVSLLVFANHQRLYTLDTLDASWQLHIVDVRRFAGGKLQLAFSAPALGHFSGPYASSRIEIALPRIVYCYGPYYAGIGGISIPGRHGGSSVHKNGHGISLDQDEIAGDALWLGRFEFVKPSSLRLSSSFEKAEYQRQSGMYWLSLRLGTQLEQNIESELIAGEVESGAFDIVPDFTKGDEARLDELAGRLEELDPVVSKQ